MPSVRNFAHKCHPEISFWYLESLQGAYPSTCRVGKHGQETKKKGKDGENYDYYWLLVK